MAKSELLDAIRDAFELKCPDVDAIAVGAFCEFATDWMAKAGIVGVGHTANGLALRFGDGSEKLLFNQEPVAISADTPSIQLATSGVSARQGIGGDAQSVQITGR